MARPRRTVSEPELEEQQLRWNAEADLMRVCMAPGVHGVDRLAIEAAATTAAELDEVVTAIYREHGLTRT